MRGDLVIETIARNVKENWSRIGTREGLFSPELQDDGLGAAIHYCWVQLCNPVAAPHPLYLELIEF